MRDVESKVELAALRRWVGSWDPGRINERLSGMIGSEGASQAPSEAKEVPPTTLTGSLVGPIQEFVASCSDASECLFGLRSMLSSVMYDCYFRAGNGVMNVGNLYELLLLPTDIATKKRLIKGFDYPDVGALAIVMGGEVVGEIGAKSDLFWHTFYSSYVREDDEEGSIEHVRDNHDHELTLQLWKPGLVRNIAEFEEYADAVIFECAEHLELALRRERFCELTHARGEAGTFKLALHSSVYERTPLTHYASAQSSSIPAHQFLGWYHVLEFYFSRARARLLQRPQQKRISERDMLTCVLENIVCWPDFFAWINLNAARAHVFTKNQPPPFSSIDLSSTSRAIESIVERVYCVRCEIVHAKEGASLAPIAPGIADARIEPELPLVRFLAGQAIKNGRQF